MLSPLQRLVSSRSTASPWLLLMELSSLHRRPPAAELLALSVGHTEHSEEADGEGATVQKVGKKSGKRIRC